MRDCPDLSVALRPGCIPLDWRGRPVVLVGSGPSLTAADVAYCRDRARVVAINDSWRLAPWADVLYACDPAWWELHCGVRDFAGEKWTLATWDAKRKIWLAAHAITWGLNAIGSVNEPGLSADPAILHQGGTSGYQALGFAVLRGADPIYLLGYDYTSGHWFGKHPQPLANTDFRQRAEHFAAAAADCRARGVTVVNCTPGSSITAFPKARLRDVLIDRVA